MALFACSVGRVRALEAKRLDLEKLWRAAPADVWPQLAAAGYRQPDPQSDPGLDDWFEQERFLLYRLADQLLADTDYPLFYRLFADRDNLFLLARRESGLAVPDGFFSAAGRIPLPDLFAAWSGHGLFRLPPVLARALANARRQVENGLAQAEFCIEQGIFDLMRRAALPGSMLGRLAAFYTDRVNIRRFLTGGRLFLSGGLVPPEAYTEENAPARVLFHYPELKRENLEPGARGLVGAAGGELETGLRQALEKILAQARFISYGPEPVIAYCCRRESEAAEIRRHLVAAAGGGN